MHCNTLDIALFHIDVLHCPILWVEADAAMLLIPVKPFECRFMVHQRHHNISITGGALFLHYYQVSRPDAGFDHGFAFGTEEKEIVAAKQSCWQGYIFLEVLLLVLWCPAGNGTKDRRIDNPRIGFSGNRCFQSSTVIV